MDLLRGFALFGVLLVNLLYFFRVSLFDRILRFHTHPGWANHAADLFVALLLEFKAFDLFALTFGMGVAVQAERANNRGISVSAFLVRRFLVLLAFGVCHLLLVSNVDILTLYAVCGLLLIPLLRLPTAVLAIVALAAIYLPTAFPRGPLLPPDSVLRAHVANATHVYGEGSFLAILAFRWRETRDLIAPLLAGVAQRTFGLMLLGVAVWRAGVIKEPRRYRVQLRAICLILGLVGLINTTAEVVSSSSGRPVEVAPALRVLGSHVNLALAYVAGLLAWRRSERATGWTAPVAAAGRMALSNYLMQTFIFAILFYGYGFGLFGKIATARAAAIGVVFYAAQLWLSVWWLNRYHFGPFEWLWRSLTYGRRQPMRIPAR